MMNKYNALTDLFLQLRCSFISMIRRFSKACVTQISVRRAPTLFHTHFSRTFFKVKIKISQDSNSLQKNAAVAFMIAHLFKKMLNYSFICTVKNFQHFSRTFSCFSSFQDFFQAWKFIFSFSRFSKFSRCVETLVQFQFPNQTFLHAIVLFLNCVVGMVKGSLLMLMVTQFRSSNNSVRATSRLCVVPVRIG